MKTLLLMRHAKSSWADPQLCDHDRPLNPRGQRDAPRMGALLRHEGLIPDRIVSSTAVRARITAEVVATACSINDRVVLTPDLYHAAAEEWSRQIGVLPDEDDTVLCIGHNPGLEDFLADSVGQHVVMPTAAIAHLTFAVTGWKEIGDHRHAKLRNVWRPKELPASSADGL